MTNCLILAEDLAGAADSAVSALHAGLDAEVFLTADGAEQSRTAVAAIDLNSREIEVERARTLTFKNLEKIHPRSGHFLYRKIESTLRGHVAVELAATRTAAGKRFILFAPAFPANRRITVGGKILVDGQPLEQTQFWNARVPRPDVAREVAGVCLTMESLRVETVRLGKQEIHRTISDLVGEGCTTILCDAEHDEDLFQIAQAGFELGPQCLFAGSGGLAKQLFKLFPASDLTIPVARRLRKRILIAVGSFAASSQTQFSKLRELAGLHWFSFCPAELATPPNLQPELVRFLGSGLD